MLPPRTDLVSDAKRRAMRGQLARDTKPEMALRQELHRRGLRYRVHVRPVPELRRTADIVFTRAHIAVFVQGCFWHRCPEHATSPKANALWWQEKLQRNVDRDEDTAERLAASGWCVIIVWEHEDPAAAADRIAVALGRGRS